MVQDVTYYPILEASGDEMIKEDNDLEPKKLIHEPLVCFVRSIGLFSNLDYQIIMFSHMDLNSLSTIIKFVYRKVKSLEI